MLSIRAVSMMVDVINERSQEPRLHKRAEPDDPGINVVHRSVQEEK